MRGITDGGYFHNHDPGGDTLYGADVYVDPDCQGKGVGGALYEARRRLCKQLNLRRILAGGRLSGYAEHEATLTPEEYVAEGDRRRNPRQRAELPAQPGLRRPRHSAQLHHRSDEP